MRQRRLQRVGCLGLSVGSWTASTAMCRSGTVFYDVGLEAGRTVYYRVRAVDAWGNQSPASASIYSEY